MARVAWRNLSYWKKIGSNLGSIRRWRGLTDHQVSKTLGMELRNYRKIEKGMTESLTLAQIHSLRSLFDVRMEELIPIL